MYCAASERPLEMTVCRTLETPATFCCICNKRLSQEFYATLESRCARATRAQKNQETIFQRAGSLIDYSLTRQTEPILCRKSLNFTSTTTHFVWRPMLSAACSACCGTTSS